jgi:hypothetical protein
MKYKAMQTVNVLVGGRVLGLRQGETYEIESSDAGDMVRAGYLQPLVAKSAPEVAAVAPSEQAVVSLAAPKTLPKGKAKRTK